MKTPSTVSAERAPTPAVELLEMKMTEKLAYTVDEAAAAIGVSSRTIRRFMSTRELPIVKIGHRSLIRTEDLNQFVNARLVG